MALYAVAPGGGTPRILSEPIGPPEFDPAIDRPAISPDGRTVTFWSWGPNDAGEVNGWGRVLDLDDRDRAHLVDVGRVGEPDQPGRPLGGGRRGAVSRSSPLTVSRQRPSIGAGLDVNGTELAFSPDGTQVLGRSNPGSALDGWFVMDIESGEATPLDVPKDATVSWQRVALP